MNFNINNSILYRNTLKSMTTEYISIYGIKAKWVLSSHKIDNVIGETKKFLSKDYVEVTLLPENSESYNNEMSYNQLGIQNLENLVVYISSDDLSKIHPNIVEMQGQGFDNIIGDIVVFESGKVLEVSHISTNINSSLNHQFVYADKKNVYKLTLVTYLGSKTSTNVETNTQQDILSLQEIMNVFNGDEKNEIKQANKQNNDTSYNKKFGTL